MKRIQRMLLLTLATALLLSGCNTSDTTWVYEAGGTRMPAGVYISYMMQAVDEAQSALYTQNSEDPDFDYPDKLSDALKMDLEGTTVQAWVEGKTRDYARSYFVVQRESERLDVTLSTEELDDLKTNVDSVWEYYGESFESNGIAQSSWMLFQQSEVLKSRLFDALYGEGGERELSENELRAIFSEEYAKADVIMIGKMLSAAEETDIDAENESRRQMAAAYLQRILGGESFEDVEFEYRQDQAADEEARAAVVKKEEGELTNIFHLDDAAYYQTGLVDAVFESPVGTAVMVDAENHFFLILRKDILTDNPDDLDSYRSTLIVNAKFDEFEEWLAAEAAAMQITVNQSAVDRYKATNIK